MENVHLIVGLGNPGAEYSGTRHNAGFLVVDELSRRWKLDWRQEKKFKTDLSKGQVAGKDVMVSRPTTFMNASGQAVAAMVEYFKIESPKVLVVVDDADLPFGLIRMRPEGSSGGHHGLLSIEEHLGTRQFARLKVGIGREAQDVRDITDYVLARFSRSDKAVLDQVLQRAADQIECWLEKGIAKAMNEFNGAVKAPN